MCSGNRGLCLVYGFLEGVCGCKVVCVISSCKGKIWEMLISFLLNLGILFGVRRSILG